MDLKLRPIARCHGSVGRDFETLLPISATDLRKSSLRPRNSICRARVKFAAKIISRTRMHIEIRVKRQKIPGVSRHDG